MTLDQLRIFVAVAERQHVTRAAEALNLVQSAVSTAIANIRGAARDEAVSPGWPRDRTDRSGARVPRRGPAPCSPGPRPPNLCSPTSAACDAGRWRSTQPDHRERLVAAPPRRPSAAPTRDRPALGRGQHHRRRRRGARRAGRTRLRRGGVGRPDACEHHHRAGPTRSRGRPKPSLRRGDRPRTRRPRRADWVLREADREPARLRGGAHGGWPRPGPNSGSRSNCPRTRRCAPPSRPGGATVLSETVVAAAIRAGTLVRAAFELPSRPFRCCATRSATAVGPPTRCSNSIATSDPG